MMKPVKGQKKKQIIQYKMILKKQYNVFGSNNNIIIKHETVFHQNIQTPRTELRKKTAA